jgi:hypothetical protein
VPIGYVPELRRINPVSAPGIDVLFYGLVEGRRNLYGAARDAYIARAKVVLNMHLYETHLFEVVRVSYLLANSKAVVAEVGRATEIDDDLRDAVVAAPDERLVTTCLDLVRNDERRRDAVQRAATIDSRPSWRHTLSAPYMRKVASHTR